MRRVPRLDQVVREDVMDGRAGRLRGEEGVTATEVSADGEGGDATHSHLPSLRSGRNTLFLIL